MDPSQLAAVLMGYAWPIGLSLLLATALARTRGRGVGPAVLLLGLAASGLVAYREWQLAHDPVSFLVVLLFAGVVSAVGLWSLDRPAPLLEMVLVAGGWYLFLRGTVGTSFTTTVAGPLAWAALVLVTLIVTETRVRRTDARGRRAGADTGSPAPWVEEPKQAMSPL